MIIDTHCHIYFDNMQDDLQEVIDRAHRADVRQMICISCDKETAQKSLDLASTHDSVYATVGLHPCYTKGYFEGLFDDFQKMIDENEKIVAVGECGLDFFKGDKSEEGRRLQEIVFERQIELAQKNNLPIVIHNREADEECLAILDAHKAEKVVFHCYGSDLEFAKKLWDRGYLTSFTGIVTYPNAGPLQEVAREVPQDLFLVETDCPFLAPQKYRGERNEPAYVVEVVEKIAELKGMSVSEVSEISTANAKRFFERLA